MSSLNKAKTKAETSIKWKIFLFLLGFCFLLLIILWLFQTVFLESFYTVIKKSEVEKQASNLAELYEQGNIADFEQMVKDRGDLYVELVNDTGDGQAIEGFFPEAGMRSWSKEDKLILYNQAIANGGTVVVQYSEENLAPPVMPIPQLQAATGKTTKTGNMQNIEPAPKENTTKWASKSIVCGHIVNTANGEQYLLLVRAAITPVNATVQTLRIQLLYISLIMIILAIAIALILSWWVAHPLQKLNNAAAALGEGNYGVLFDASGYKEVSELSQTLSVTAKELAKTETLRRDLIANVSHDLRTPLTLITGYAEMMRDIPGENSAENMQVIIDEAKRLSSLVGELLDLSQLEAGVGGLRPESFDLTKVIEEIIERFSKFSEKEGYQVIFVNERQEHATVWADKNRISQVVYNFLINAITHSEKESKVEIKQIIQKNTVKIEVKDKGEGIPKEQIPYIWDRYYKVDKEHKRPITGAGLGLSIVKNILIQHPNVEYGVESEQNCGSVFWFSLPLEKISEK